MMFPLQMGDVLVPAVNFPGCTLPEKKQQFASANRPGPPKQKDCPPQAPFFRGYVMLLLGMV